MLHKVMPGPVRIAVLPREESQRFPLQLIANDCKVLGSQEPGTEQNKSQSFRDSALT